MVQIRAGRSQIMPCRSTQFHTMTTISPAASSKLTLMHRSQSRLRQQQAIFEPIRGAIAEPHARWRAVDTAPFSYGPLDTNRDTFVDLYDCNWHHHCVDVRIVVFRVELWNIHLIIDSQQAFRIDSYSCTCIYLLISIQSFPYNHSNHPSRHCNVHFQRPIGDICQQALCIPIDCAPHQQDCSLFAATTTTSSTSAACAVAWWYKESTFLSDGSFIPHNQSFVDFLNRNGRHSLVDGRYVLASLMKHPVARDR